MQRSKVSGYVKFTQENVDHLCQEISRMEDSRVVDPVYFSDVLRELAEVIIWSDRNAERVFDSFLERNMMRTFELVVTNAEVSSLVKVQVIQCIALMLQNLTRQSSRYFICSNNHLNRIISIELDETDDALLEIHTSFLKTVALRLNEDTVQFFFDRVADEFPLFNRACNLLSVSNYMVRTTAQQIVIIVAQLTDPAVTVFLRRTIGDVLGVLAAHLWAVISQLGAETIAAAPLQALDKQLEDVIDYFMYFNDLFEVSRAFAPASLSHILDTRVVAPLTEALVANAAPVRAVTAMCILARWLQLNRVGWLTALLRRRLFPRDRPSGPVSDDSGKNKDTNDNDNENNDNDNENNDNDNENNDNDNENESNDEWCDGLVGRVVRGGDMALIPSAVALIDAMVHAGLFAGAPVRNDPVEDVDVWDVDPADVSRIAADCDASLAMDRDAFAAAAAGDAPAPLAALIAVLHMCFAHSDCARIAVFAAAMRCAGRCAGTRARRTIVLRALLSLCVSTARRRAAVSSVSSVCAEPSAGAWPNTPHAALFVCLLHAIRAGPPDALRCDASLLLPQPAAEAPRGGEREQQQEEGGRRSSGGSGGGSSGQGFELRAWLFARCAAHGPGDLLCLSLRALSAQRAAGEALRCVPPGALLCLRCELAAPPQTEITEIGAAGGTGIGAAGGTGIGAGSLIATGTAMQMALYPAEMLFIAVDDDAADADEDVPRRVLFALENMYADAALDGRPFGVAITYARAGEVSHLRVAFRHSQAAQAAVAAIREAAARVRSCGEAIARTALNLSLKGGTEKEEDA